MSVEQETTILALFADMDLRFTSGNSIPVERTHIKADEYALLKQYILANLKK